MPTDAILVVVAVVSMFSVFGLALLWADLYSCGATVKIDDIKDGHSHM